GQDVDLAVFGIDPFDATAPQCLAGGRNSATVANAPAGSYLVVVDGFAAATSVPFQLSSACGSSGLVCAGVPDLTCNSKIAGDTATGSSTAFAYGNIDNLFIGKELVYHFNNPV